MALLPILHYPDPRLHTVAKPVAVVDDGIRKLINDMAETMYAAPGVGLAATQVDVHKRVLIIDISARAMAPAFVNPEIIERTGKPRTRKAAFGSRHLLPDHRAGADGGPERRESRHLAAEAPRSMYQTRSTPLPSSSSSTFRG